MDEVSKLKKQVAIYGLAVIAVCEIVSLFIIGFDIGFTVFLLAGFAAALVNFWLLAFFLQKMLDSGNAGFSTISFVIRILIYCAVFFISVKQGHTPSWVGCLIGILAPKVPLYYSMLSSRTSIRSVRFARRCRQCTSRRTRRRMTSTGAERRISYA